MPRTYHKLAQRRQAVIRRYDAAPFVLIKCRIALHERIVDVRARGPCIVKRCPCCGSDQAMVTRWIDDMEILVHRATHWRKRLDEIEDPEDVAKFREVADAAQPYGTEGASCWVVPMVFRIAADDLEYLTGPLPTVTFFSGGWRGRKTMLAANRFARDVLRNGGSGTVHWLLAPIRKQAHRLLKKLFFGTAKVPPVFPREGLTGPSLLAISIPTSEAATDQTVRLVDGSLIELMHMGRKGSGLEGEEVETILMDECQKVASGEPFSIARSRVMSTGGRLLLASVPPSETDRCDWLYQDVVALALQEDALELQGEKVDRYYRVVPLSSFDNPWVDRREIQRAYDKTPDETTRQRKFLGEWSAFGQLAYKDTWRPHQHEHDHISCLPAAWGYDEDVTELHAKRIFGRPAAWLGGGDFNASPQTVLLAKVFRRNKNPDTDTLVVLDEQVLMRSEPKIAAARLSERKGGRYKDTTGIVFDANGFHDGHVYSGTASKTSDAFRYQQAGFLVTSPNEARSAPGKKPARSNPHIGESRNVVREVMRADRLLVNRGACPSLCNAIAKAPNRPKRHSDAGTWLDREVYSCEDSLRYIVWRVFSPLLLQRPSTPVRIYS